MKENFLDRLTIRDFRGIDSLELSDFSDVNLFLGLNNGGKTSVLEAIACLRSGALSNLIDICSERTKGRTKLEDLKFLFREGSPSFSVGAVMKNEKPCNLECKYAVKTTTFDEDVFKLDDEPASIVTLYSYLLKNRNLKGKEVPLMDIDIDFNGEHYSNSLLDLDLAFNRVDDVEDVNNIVYLHPSDHFNVASASLAEILKSSKDAKLLADVMKLFDPNIKDIISIPNEFFDGNSIYVRRTSGDPIPLTVYGDGSKKALTLAIAIAKAKNGILLIDEVETSLHHLLLEDICYFLVEACKRNNIQLFATTHNDETLDCFYKVIASNEDCFRLYTLRKGEKKHHTRLLKGLAARRYRDIGVEVRD